MPNPFQPNNDYSIHSSHSNNTFMHLSVPAARLAVEQAKVAHKDQVLGIECVALEKLSRHTQNHIRNTPLLGTVQLAVLVVISTSSLATSPSLFLEAFKEPEGMKGFEDPRFQKAFGDPKAWDRMCKAAKGELTSTIMSGSRYVTSESIPYVVETLEVHDPEAEANQTPDAYPQRPPLDEDLREAWLKQHAL